ncbi:hypothetical protein NQ318_009238 [Aromia moschata]|uniref:Mos1 transposase HTH domain-containing protein n=1 Tax=Aromia moschata TaxID=1265417 RepID=A0AAV8YCA3_9CUCU|nr:hypothetical protein NQ318_009238 [Aromia moschata]
MLSVQLEQRVNLKFPVKLGKTFTKAYAMLKEMYGNESLSCTQVFEWFKRFKEGRETTEDDPRPGRPSTENIEKIATPRIVELQDLTYATTNLRVPLKVRTDSKTNDCNAGVQQVQSTRAVLFLR